MSASTDLDKLRILLSHWVEHNREHAREFLEWAQRIEPVAEEEIVSHLRSGGQAMDKVNESLVAALKHLGGSPEKGHH
jgi:hypothetical protein